MNATGRHLDQTARMLWLTMARSAGDWTVAQLVYHWRPTFATHEVQDALQRLVANGYARATSNYRSANTFTTGGCDPLPGYPTHRSIPAVSSAATSPTSPTLELLS